MVSAVLAFTVAAVLPPAKVCAIDMGSNTFRRIVGSFVDGRHQQAKPELRPVGVGDDVATP